MTPSRLCPRFERCSVNRCLLDPGYLRLEAAEGDLETRCTLGKARRVRIAAQHPGVLPTEGLTPHEYANRGRKPPMGRPFQIATGRRFPSKARAIQTDAHPSGTSPMPASASTGGERRIIA